MTRRAKGGPVRMLGLLLAGGLLTRGAEDKPAKPDFRADVLPILERCQVCHDGNSKMGALDLTSREKAIEGGRSGAALKPGNAAESLLYQLSESGEMPQGDPLSDRELRILRAWIDAGAEWGEDQAGAPDK
jgi:hypothetical protein